mmetsp:Transcript_26544/g.57028  ORF Transcript_26544/g.57028 Transcript_26544/m.57028 type:complete len:131 (-) Transcript_26544:546-938(-)
MAALKALVELGSDGGIGKGRIWFLLDNGTKRVMELCPDDNTIAEQIGTTRDKMQSAFGRFWKTKLQAGQLGVGFHAWQMNSGVYVTVGACNDLCIGINLILVNIYSYRRNLWVSMMSTEYIAAPISNMYC